MTIVILGEGINTKGQLPKQVKRLLDKGIKIFGKHKDAKILLSGRYSFLYPKDKIPKKTEAEAMRDYLLKFGVPKKKIYLDKKSKDTIGYPYYTKKLYFLPKKERKALIITSDFHLKRVKFVFKKIFGKNYQFKFISVPIPFKGKKRIEIFKRQEVLLQKTKKILAKMKSGDHNFLKGKLYKIKYYKEKRPDWAIKFVTQGK